MMKSEYSINNLLKDLFNTGELTLQKAEEIIENAGGLPNIARMSCDEIEELTDLKKKNAKRIFSAIELGRKALVESTIEKKPLLNSKEVHEYLLPRIGWPEEEEFWILALDIRQRPIKLSLVAKGSSTEVTLSLGSLFKTLIRTGAPRGICCHTHPSGDPSPSETDINLTDRIIEVSSWLGISIVDHIILGQGNYTSLADKGYI
jgi:DNA repair protein RadC